MKHLKQLVVALLLLCSATVCAHDFEVDGIYYNITDETNKTVEVTYSGSSYGSVSNEYTGIVVIPSTVTYNDVIYNVTTIGSEAFGGCSGLTSITIPNSITTIGNNAFIGCSSLKELYFEDGSETLSLGYNEGTFNNDALFNKCPLETLYLGRELSYNTAGKYGYSPFCNIKTLKNVTIGNSVTTIGDNAFRGCSGLTSVTIPNSVTTIGIYAFNQCTGLTSVTIGNGVTSIGSSAFDGCTGLTSITIPNSVTTIGIYAFSRCSGLTSLTIPNSVTTIGDNAFYSCTGLTNITIGNSVTNIDKNAFNGCSGLTNITIPNSVTTIGNNAFKGCSSLKELYFEDGSETLSLGYNEYTYYNDALFNECPLETLYLGRDLSYNTSGSNVYSPFYNIKTLKNITIGDKVTDIGSNMFLGCDEAKIIVENENPVAVTIGSKAFGEDILVYVPDASYPLYCKTDGWKTQLSHLTCEGYDEMEVEVEALSNNSGIMNAIGVDYISAVRKLKVKGSINSYDVIQFRDKMPGLRSLDISETTVVASDKAFYNGYCTGDNIIGDYAFYKLELLKEVKLPSELKEISSYTFYNCSELTEVTIGNSIISIGDYAFEGCSKLTNVTIPNSVTTIGSRAFLGCTGLTSLTLPNSVTTIGGQAFFNCDGITSVKIPYGVIIIEGQVLAYCDNLTELVLPPTIKNIKNGAFSGCTSLEEIRIPSSVESIGREAFGGCSKLNKVYTYTVEPTLITETTFSTFSTATLYIPSTSFANYYWDDGWKRFLTMETFDEPYEYFYVNNDYVLNDETGYIYGLEGKNPDADINAGGGLIIEGTQSADEDPNQKLGGVSVCSDGNGNSASVIGDNNLQIDDMYIKINVSGGRWYFFAFPYNIPYENISMEKGSDFVFRYYDGEERATNGTGGWKDVETNSLEAACGYIFQCSANDVLVLNIKDVKFDKEDKCNELVTHVSDNLKDASWNFTGNPYLSYYNLADTDYTAPVTVWDGTKYVAIRPGDDDYHFVPYEAFFVQKPEGKEEITFDGEGQMTQNQAEAKMELQQAARRVRGINPDRFLVNITLSNDDDSDRTRVVFNERQTSNYETACDAAKFRTNGVTQLYTIDNEGIHYAINERPAGKGTVAMGYTAVVNGMHTIAVQRMDIPVYLIDKKNETVHDFNDGEYSFTTEAGTFENRFEISLTKGTTGIEDIEDENGNDKTMYDLQGRKVKHTGKGIYIVDGEKKAIK